MMHVDSGVGTLMKVKVEVWFNREISMVQHINSSGGVSTRIIVVEDMERRWIQSKLHGYVGVSGSLGKWR